MVHDTPAGLRRVLEALLLSSSTPLDLDRISLALGEELAADVLRRTLDELRDEWRDRQLELVRVAEGWRFQTRPQMQLYVERLLAEKPARYSRAVMEMLAIIAYKQPVTRGDIEEIRGVAVNAQHLRILEQRGWIRVAGHRNVPGRPELFVTTPAFLSDLGLRSLEELPMLQGEDGPLTPNPANAELDLDADAG